MKRMKSLSQQLLESNAKSMNLISGIPFEDCILLLEPQGEEHTVRIIKQYLRTPEQKKWLDEVDLSIEDVLNGRFRGDLERSIKNLFLDWNAKLGRKVFGFGD